MSLAQLKDLAKEVKEFRASDAREVQDALVGDMTESAQSDYRKHMHALNLFEVLEGVVEASLSEAEKAAQLE